LRGRHGFTLLELVLVIFVMALTSSILIPRIGSGWKAMEEREFLQQLVQTLKRAQIRAMSGGEATLFRISGAERAFGLESPPLQNIPENVDIYSDLLERDPLTFDRIMVFYPDGSVSDNDLKITFDKQRSYRIFVHPISGTIRLVKG
jgi:prepilin-type N-terminal cleavage/methylation domain-containing protein